MTAKLCLRRGLDAGVLLSGVVVLIDGIPRAHVHPCADTSIDVTPGHHVVEVIVDSTRSRPIEADVTEGTVVHCWVRIGSLWSVARHRSDAVIVTAADGRAQ